MTTAVVLSVDRCVTINLDNPLRRGDDYVWAAVLSTNTGTETAPVLEPRDLTGHTFLSQIRATTEDTTVMATLTVEPQTDWTDGAFWVKLPHTQSVNLKPGRVAWDLQMTTPEGFVQTIATGRWKVEGDTSRDV